MPAIMPDRTILVKQQYSPCAVACARGVGQNADMRNVRELRKQRDLSQVQLAEAVGCSQGMIAKIERGEANPTLQMIERIAAALKVSPASLFGLTDLQNRALSAFADLPPERQAAALTVLEAMAAVPQED